MSATIDALIKQFDSDCHLDYEMSDQDKDYITFIMQYNPAVFGRIETGIQEFVKKGRVGVHDIPQIVVLLSKLFQDHKEAHGYESVDLFNVVEFVLDTMIDSRVIPFHDMESTLVKRVIGSSLELLKMNVQCDTKERKCWGFC